MIKKNNYAHVLLSIFLWGVMFTMFAQGLHSKNTYLSKELKTIAEKAAIISFTDTLSEGIHYRCITYKNSALTVIVNKGEVVHIGYSVFTPTQRALIDSYECNFVERYALTQKLPMERVRTNDELMKQDNVVFLRKGSFDTMKCIMADTTLSICVNKQNNRNVISWSKNGELICEIGFPSSYKLLLGMEMDELDAKLKGDILSTKVFMTDSLCEFQPGELVKSVTNDYYVRKGTYYYFAELNSNCYLQPVSDNNLDNMYKIMFNDQYPQQSLANMMTTTALANNLNLQIRQEVYGKHDSLFQVPLIQYVAYCLERGCKPYFCVIREKEGIMDCELIMNNDYLQYNHVMRMNVATADVRSRSGIIKARLDAYVPTHYLNNLFNDSK